MAGIGKETDSSMAQCFFANL